MSFEKLLIANRGEISVRVARACRRLGITSVAVYSESDTSALHVREADEAYPIGPAAASESYLNIERIVAAIRDSGADAVHPGYGFLSESAEFARAVESAGAVWVGPSPGAMEAMGFKVRAKDLARRAGVPIIPGYDGGDQSEERLAEEAERIGYPVLVKASAGGGGRGMREVRESREFADAVIGAKREAEAAFGDGSVFLEKLVERPRHIEVQVIGDDYGNVLHLFERECSIQRRHQKVVEEAPSPALDDALRERICASAVRLAKEASYRNAGTVEFLLSEGGEFYFLEMNARLQVEHPVTEMITGLDLVALQLAVSAGQELPLSQDEVRLSGRAVEARVYAEGEGGLPAGGRLLAFDPPEGEGIRNDSGVETGDEVSLDYDAMISKLIVHAPRRRTAVASLEAALADFHVRGVPTNLPLLARIARNPAFIAGETTTDFLTREGLLGEPGARELPAEVLGLAALGDSVAERKTTEPFEAGNWRALGRTQLSYLSGSREVKVEVSRLDGEAEEVNGVEALVAGERLAAEFLSRDGERSYFVVEGRPARVEVGEEFVRVSVDGEIFEVARRPPPEVSGTEDAAATGSLVAPMPGTVVRVAVSEGEEVEEGQLLLVLEAMKMEQSITAPAAGVVASLPFAEGERVVGGDVLVEIEAR